MSKKYQDALDNLLDRPIAFNPSFKKITGSTNAALLLSQAFYWTKRTSDPEKWFYKTRDEWMEETGLTESELDGAREKCRNAGVIEEKLKGVPATVHYRVNKQKVYELLGFQFPGFPESSFPENNQFPEKPESGSYGDFNKETETTTKITSDQLSFLKKAGLEWMIAKGASIEELEQAIAEAKRKENVKAFEKALGFSKALPWWSDKVWSEFAEWVCDRHAESPTCFGEYNIWRNTPFTKGGMANTRIRSFVKEFYDSWDMFMMATKPDVFMRLTNTAKSVLDQVMADLQGSSNA